MSAAILHRLLLIAPFQKFRDQGGPAGLVAGAQPGPVVAVKVLVERDVVTPARIGLEQLVAAEDRPPARTTLVAEEDSREPARQVAGAPVQIDLPARAGGELDLEVAAEVAMVLAERRG